MEEQSQQLARPTQGPDGKFVASVEAAIRDAEAARLRGLGMSYRAIAAQLGIDVHTAHDAVKRALNAIRAEGAAEAVALELERFDASLQRLDTMQAAAEAVLRRRHVHVSGGKIVMQITAYARDDEGNILLDVDGNPKAENVEQLEDDAPVLAAVDRLVKIEVERRAIGESRRKLLGLDAEQKVSVSGGVTYEIVGIPAEEL